MDDAQHKYDVIIQGEHIKRPIQTSVTWPEWLGDMVIKAQDEEQPTSEQKAVLETAAERITMLYAQATGIWNLKVGPGDFRFIKLGDI